MKKKDNKNKSIIIGIVVTMLVTITLLGITYGYYITKILGNSNDKSLNVTSKDLEVTYEDGAGGAINESVEPGESFSKEFKVRNTGTAVVDYGVKIDKVNNKFKRQQDWTYKLEKKIENSYIEIKKGQLPNTDSYLLNKQTIATTGTDEYRLTITYENSTENQNEYIGKELTFKVNIGNAIGEVFETAQEGTLLKKIGENNLISEPLTIPGKEVSIDEEAELAYTEDDYGTSYYYRGNVINNFVNFGNMCWRIMRVQGDGSIKIVLADENRLCNDEKYNITNKNTAFVNGGKSMTYNTNSELKENLKFSSSDLVELLKQWLENQKLNINENIKKDAEWCMDMSEVDTNINFGSHNRIYPVNTANPSLKCNFIGLNGSKSEKYKNSIALLTVDEISYAGGIYAYLIDTSSYIFNNTGTWWWTMSPDYFVNDSAHVWGIHGSGGIGNANIFVANSGAVRPSIVLKSSTQIDSGIGTQTEPYIIST